MYKGNGRVFLTSIEYTKGFIRFTTQNEEKINALNSKHKKSIEEFNKQ